MSLTTLYESELESDLESVAAPHKPEKRSSVDSTTSSTSTASWSSSSSGSSSRMKRLSTRLNGMFNGETLRTPLNSKCTHIPPIGPKHSSIQSMDPQPTPTRRSSSIPGLNDILKAAPVVTPDYLMDLANFECEFTGACHGLYRN